MVLPVHDIPGRLRFALPPLRGNRRRAAMARARMRAIEGVVSASANPLTGSLIVHYRGAATRENILAALAEFRPNPAAPEPVSDRHASKLADILANAIAERIIEHALRLAVAAAI